MNRDSAIRQREAPSGNGSMQWSGYDRGLHRFFVNRLRNAEDARDLTQEVYLRLLRAGNPGAIRDFPSYVYRIAANVAHEYLHRAREPQVNFDSEAAARTAEQETDRPDELYEQLSNTQELERMLKRLPPVQQVIVVLQMGQGFSCDQIAGHLGLSRHTVKKYLTRAIARLRAEDWSADAGGKRP